MSLSVEVLERSFALVKDRGEAFSEQFYATLFLDYPGVKPLFAHTRLAEQGKKLFASLVLVVDSLRKPEALESALKGLGTRHIQYGVLPQHYPMVGNSLLKTLAWALDDHWTPEVQQAWVEAYGGVSQLMLEGADYPAEDLKLSQV
ncbi:MAG: globin domain-containing protein [Oculatellaceae cyanobacterium Prado106]|jgi:hemoglobin-like flavoprotein|nr:globin domain-containing protein [Oculatellaceae cyanobacterium Prado106]